MCQFLFPASQLKWLFFFFTYEGIIILLVLHLPLNEIFVPGLQYVNLARALCVCLTNLPWDLTTIQPQKN